MSKRWSGVGVVAGAMVSLAALGYYWLLRRPLARTQGTVRLDGLNNQVELIRDRWGVPHIYAQNIHDLMFAQGFVHGQDRLWQMDFNRRLIAGRLSEIMGERTVEVDRWLRTLSMRRVADEETDLLPTEAREHLEAYASGVNARIKQGRLPIEFTLLNYRPEPWTVADSLSWVKMMSWTLSINWETELLRALLIERIGVEKMAELDLPYPETWPIIVPPEVDLSQIGDSALDRATAARPFIGPPAQAGLGSNNWAVAGSHTTTGAPLFANDMHLPMSLPAIWYENHLVGGDLNVTGVTFPGIPGVVSGHNGHVAWGYTNGFPDVQDLYMERLRRCDDGRVQYEYMGMWRDAKVIHEEIRIKGCPSEKHEVILTHHGPIINELAPDLSGEQPLSLRWTSLEPDTMVAGLFDMMRAQNCLEFHQALRSWAAPIQNTVYADTEGNIGYTFAGKLPIRAQGQGAVPVPGWTGENEWIGYVPFDELPHFYNPDQGYIATANNRVASDDYPYHISHEFATGDRARRIIELIESQEKIDIDHIQRMQFDLVSPAARIAADHLGRLQVNDPQAKKVVEMLRNWDGDLREDSSEAAVYQVFARRLLDRMLSGQLGDLAIRYMGKGPIPLLAEGCMFSAKSEAWLQQTLNNPSSAWFDLGNGETRDQVLILVLAETIEYLQAELGPNIRDWTWGKLHTLTYSHTLGGVPVLGALFNRGPFPLGGDGTTVWATGASSHNLDSDLVIGPPFRFIADLSDLRNSFGLLAPGQSGQPGSQHYDDQMEAWHTADYHQMLYTLEDVEKEARGRLHLIPKTTSSTLKQEGKK